MFVNKLRTVSLVMLLIGSVTGGVGVWARWTPIEANQPGQDEQTGTSAAPKPITQLGPGGPRLGIDKRGVSLNPGSPKNYPNLAAFNDPIPVFGTGSILLVTSPDGKTLEARSVDDENVAWQRLPIPDGQQVTPIASKDVLALAYKGEGIGAIAAFSAHTGEWSLYNLESPLLDTIVPALGPDSALYQVGNDFYAFSALKGKWDLLSLPADPKARASISEKYIQVQQGDRLYVFGLKHGRWSKGVTMKLPPAKSSKPNSQPAAQ